MKRIAFLVLGAFTIVLSFTVRDYAKETVWIAIYPPPPERIALYLIPYIMIAVGLILIVLALFYPFGKGDN